MRNFILMVIAALFLAAPAKADPLHIRIGWVAMPSELQPVLFANGVAKHDAKSYTVQAIHYQGTPLMITALSTGDLDIAPLAFSALGSAVVNAGMRDLRVIGDEFQDGVDGYHTNLFLVGKESPIRRVEDLKGKVVASNEPGSAVDLAIRVMLRRHGLLPNRDYSIVQVAFPNLKPMLLEKKVDLIPAMPPFVFDPKLQANSRVLFTRREALGVTDTIVWTAKATFIEKNRAALLDFMEDSIRSVRWYMNPANHDEAVSIFAKAMKAPPSALSDWLFTKKDLYRNPNMMPNIKALQSSIDLMHQMGFLKSSFEVSKYADLSLVKEAAKRVK